MACGDADAVGEGSAREGALVVVVVAVVVVRAESSSRRKNSGMRSHWVEVELQVCKAC